MRFYIFKIIIFIFTFFFCTEFASSNNKKKSTAMELIYSSETSLKNLISNPEFENLKDYISNARAILIFPKLYEGGLIFGAKGGNGLLIIRRADNKFTGPFFYSIGGLSFGLQIGAKSAKVIMTIMTNRGLKSIVKEGVKLGVDVDSAVINSGVGYSAESTLRLSDIFTFSDNAGLFIGGSFDGSYLQPRNDLNKIVHNTELSAEDILRNNSYKKESESLKKIIFRITNDNKN